MDVNSDVLLTKYTEVLLKTRSNGAVAISIANICKLCPILPICSLLWFELFLSNKCEELGNTIMFVNTGID